MTAPPDLRPAIRSLLRRMNDGEFSDARVELEKLAAQPDTEPAEDRSRRLLAEAREFCRDGRGSSSTHPSVQDVLSVAHFLRAGEMHPW